MTGPKPLLKSPSTSPPPCRVDDEGSLIDDLTASQREAVTHERGPLLIIAGAGTGKTTVIARRIAWLLTTGHAAPQEILALTFTEKAAAEMEERVDRLLPYGMTDVRILTFHAFGDALLREHALSAGLAMSARVLSKVEQAVFLREHLFELPLGRFRPAHDPARYVEALATVFSRAKDEAVTPEAFLAYAAAAPTDATAADGATAAIVQELASTYAAYQQLLARERTMDFGDQILSAITLFEREPELLAQYRRQMRYLLVDEFQDTNFAQFRLLQLLAPPAANVTVVADDDQSIYKWRGAAISNVLKFLDHYQDVRRLVLTENFRSTQAILDSAYRLIRHNDPDRLEVREQIDKRLVAKAQPQGEEPALRVFETASQEADWVAQEIQAAVAAGTRAPGDFAILVRTNRAADLFLRALNVCGVPWSFSGSSGLFARDEIKMLLSCLRTLADPSDSLSLYHVLSSALYACPMADLVACLSVANRTHASLRAVCESRDDTLALSDEGRARIARCLEDVTRFVELSRRASPGQLLYRWLSDTGWLKRHANPEQGEELAALQTVARFFDRLRRFEDLIGNRLPEFMRALDLFQAFGDTVQDDAGPLDDDRVHVLTLHKAKGLEFPVVFLVGLVQGRFPTPLRRDPIELPEPLIQDILPSGDYHLQEERRLCYVGMTRAQETLHLTTAYHYGGRSVRKVSQFAREALPSVPAAPSPIALTALERIHQPIPSAPSAAVAASTTPRLPEPLRLSPYGVDDYVTCPLKFQYSHLLRVPIMRHHLIVYGAALHAAVEQFFKRVLVNQPMTLEELWAVFEQAWISEGFFSLEHEQQRLAQGKDALRRFYEAQQRAPERPTFIEKKFSVPVDDFLVVGRWDRVDYDGEEAVIIDYKSSDVHEQAQADRRVRDSLQMGVYALAWQRLHGRLPARLELRFLETGFVGQRVPTDDDLIEVEARLREAARGIRAGAFQAQPQQFSCRWCAYQTICPFAISTPV